MALGFVSVGSMIRICKGENSKIYWIVSSVCAVLAGWGSLEVAGAFCAMHLLLLTFSFTKLREKKMLFSSFALSFLAALTNSLAPGNFLRLDSEGGGDTSIIGVVNNTFRCMLVEGESVLKSPIFIVACLLAFLFVIFSNEFLGEYTVSLIKFLVALVFAFLIQFVMAFPVLFGLNSDSLCSSRTEGTYEILARLVFIFVICCFGLCIRNFGKRFSYVVAIVVSLLLLISFAHIDEKNIDWDNAHFQGTMQDIQSGNLLNNYRMREYVLAQCEMADPGSDVVLWVDSYDNRMSYGMGAIEDPNNQVNLFIAYLFGLNSFTIFYQ